MNNRVYADLLYTSLQQNAEKPCMHIKRDGAYQTWTYADFHRDINHLASAMKKDGFTPGSRAVVIGENTPEWVIAWHCGFLSKGITVPIDPNLPAAEIEEIVQQTQSHTVFCSKSFLSLFLGIKADRPFLKRIVLLEQSSSEALLTFDTFCQTGNALENVFDNSFLPEDLTVIIFTSGTTGTAKGVMLNQQNFTAISLDAIPRIPLVAGNTMMAMLPLHHVFGACACMPGALGSGLDIVLIPTIKGALIMEGMRDKNVTALPAVPKILQLFYNHIQQNVAAKGFAVKTLFAILTFISYTLGHFLGQPFRKSLFSSVHKSFGGKLAAIVSGGASLPKKYFNGFKLMGFSIIEGYGLSETFGAITLCPPNDARLGSVGLPLLGNELRIDNANAAGIGEVCMKGVNIFPGYYNKPEITAKVFDENGWFHTGDLGKLDKDGFLYIVGRIKDIIVLDSGKNVYPDELEAFYAKSTTIEELGVFSAELKGKEIAAALVVPSEEIRKNNSVTEAFELVRNEILRMGRDLPSYKKITDFAVVYDPLPQTTTKKLKKHELREIYYSLKETRLAPTKSKQTVSDMEVSLLETDTYKAISSCAARLSHKNRKTVLLPHFLLEIDLGFDSLRQLDLLCMIERKYRIEFPESALFKIQTLGDVYTQTMELLSNKQPQDYGENTSNIKQRIVSTHVTVPYPLRGVNRITNALPHIINAASSALWKVNITGNAAVPEDTPLIFCANRQSQLDPLWVLFSLPSHIRMKTYIISGKDILPSPLLSQLSQNIIPVQKDDDIVSILRLSIAVIKDKNNLLIFPEAGSSVTGELRKFKSGIGMLMLAMNCTILPIRIRETKNAWQPGKLPNIFNMKKASPSITFGGSLTFQNLITAKHITPYSTADQIAASVRDIISEM